MDTVEGQDPVQETEKRKREECAVCSDEEAISSCHTCSVPLCHEHEQSVDHLDKECIGNVQPNVCAGCKKKGCAKCLLACEGCDWYNLYCPPCQEERHIVSVQCPYHPWIAYCDKTDEQHDRSKYEWQGGCAMCDANANYAGKMGAW